MSTKENRFFVTAVVFLATYFLCLAIAYCETTPEFKTLSDATMILYRQTMSGGMEMNCTATVFEKDGNNYKLLTASHCVTEPKGINDALVVTKQPLFVTLDEDNDKGFLRVEVERAGIPDNGYDMAVLSVTTERPLTAIPLGNEGVLKDGEEILAVSVPLGVGKTCFRGHVARHMVDRPIESSSNHINWQGGILLQIAAAPGSSGTAIFSTKQNSIVSVLVGEYGGCVIGIPISRLKDTNEENWIK